MAANSPLPPKTLTLASPAAEHLQDPTEEQQHEMITKTPPFSSISLSLSLPSLTLFSPKPSSLPQSPSPFISNLKIPSQISSLSLSTDLISNRPASKKPSRLTASLTPLLSPSLLRPLRPAFPSSAAAAGCRTSIVWFRSDLRVHDNEALSSASADSLSLLPVFLFDPRDFGRSQSGFERTGRRRAQFLIQSVSDLRESLRSRGSDLVVRIGRPETVLVELAKTVGADAVYAHREVSVDEVRAEERVEKAMEKEGIDVKYFWGSTLYHIEDLPFDLERMPTSFGGFREKVKGIGVRKTIEALEQIKGLPLQGDVKVGEVPSLSELGLNLPPVDQEGTAAVCASLKGGEAEALERLKEFAAECHAQSETGIKDGSRVSLHGANFSCKISPWLATGCLSPRFMFEELKKTATRTISSATQKNGASPGDNGMKWLMFELLWRDFFRFITKKYSSHVTKTEAVPATACTGALV